MAEQRFTRGPWIADDPDHLSAELIDENYHFVDSTGYNPGLHIAFYGSKADARLIAASPAMYGLLREGLIGQKADGSFTDDTWLTRVRDLLEDEIDMDEEAS